MNRREFLQAFTPGSGLVAILRSRGNLEKLSPVEKFGVVKDLALFFPSALAACQPKKNGEIDQRIAEYHAKEEKLEPFISRFEEGFSRFEEETLRRLAVSGTTLQERTILLNPFELFRINKNNADRNIYTLKRKDLETRRSLESQKTTVANPNYYFYDFIPVEKSIYSATFSPITKSIALSEQYDPNNTLDSLVAHHELIHVAQDNQDRLEIPADAYFKFHTSPGHSGSQLKTIPLYEASAYAGEIYLLNLFTDGEFRADVLKGKGDIDAAKFRDQLHAREDQAPVISLLGKIAYKYYTTLPSLTGIHQEYLNFVAEIYKAQGSDLYNRTRSGYVPMR